MSLNNFDFPSVTLRQSYADAGTGLTSALGVACIGPRYVFHRADVESEAVYVYNSSSYNWLSGLNPVYFDSFNTTDLPTEGGKVDTENFRLVVKNGLFKYADIIREENSDSSGSYYYKDSDSVVDEFSTSDARSAGALVAGFGFSQIENNTAVLKFGLTSAGRPLVLADGNGWVANAVFDTRGVQVGDFIYLSTNTYANSSIRAKVIDTIADSEGRINELQLLFDVVPSGVTISKPVLDNIGQVSFCFQQDYTFEKNDGAFTLTGTSSYTLTLGAQVKTKKLAVIGNTEGTLMSGDFYVEFREQVAEGYHELGSFETLSEIAETLGPVNKDNPLALACYFALAGGQGNTVYYTVVENADNAEDYTDAVDFLDNYSNIYSIVPCSEKKEVVQACLAACETLSNNEESKTRHVCWYGITESAETVLESDIAGTVTASSAVVTFTTRPFFAHKFKAGDQLRTASNVVYNINSVSSSNTCTVDRAFAESGTVYFSLYRTNPSAADIVDDVVKKRCTTSERAMAVWGDGLTFNGEVVGANYPLAAAAAGMRSYEPCQRPISNLGYSFFSLKNTYGLTKSQLKTIGSNGIWIIANNSDGTPVNKRQITTAIANNLNKDEESIIANADTIAMSVINIGQNWVGCSNISPNLLLLLEDTLDRVLNSMTIDNTGDPLIGAQLLSYEIVSIYQDPVNLDRAYAVFNVEPPKPFNKFPMTMRVI